MNQAQPMKRKVRVTITKEIEVELTPAVFGGLSQKQYLEEFSKGLWPVDGIDDVFLYAAEMAATCGSGYSHDGIGLLSNSYSTHPRVPDAKFVEISEDLETEFIAP